MPQMVMLETEELNLVAVIASGHLEGKRDSLWRPSHLSQMGGKSEAG
jgi:hypothetical protein